MARMGQPNIVLVITHDTGTHLGCYGAGVATPYLDRLAAEGVQFDHAHCTAPLVSMPSDVLNSPSGEALAPMYYGAVRPPESATSWTTGCAQQTTHSSMARSLASRTTSRAGATLSRYLRPRRFLGKETFAWSRRPNHSSARR